MTLHQCIRSLSGANLAPDHHGYPRASRLTRRKTSKGHLGTQSRGCAGQTVRPSLHSISQTSVGKLSYRCTQSVFNPILMSEGSGEAIPRSHHRSLARWSERLRGRRSRTTCAACANSVLTYLLPRLDLLPRMVRSPVD